MTTRDPRSRDSLPGIPGGRDPTQSLSLDSDDLHEPSHPSLALGTHEAARNEHTRVESPAAQKKVPTAPPARGSGGGRPPPPPVRTDDGDARIGSVLGSYRVLELLGKGGMGYVFRAEHIKLGREVALKLLRSDYARRRDAVARFFQEARTVNRVRHRNIVDVTDFVELDDGTTFIIMELLSGQSLGKWARTGIDMPRALAVLVQICDGLSAAHQVSVVHRDLKPDNIIVIPTSDGAELVKLLDFGVAKLLNRDDEDVGFQTAAGSVIGTPAYMSPEQAGGMVVDARSDTYSLGAIMYELFCGQPMFRGRSFGEYVRKHLTEMPIPPRATQGGAQIEPRLEQLILKCLEKDPSQRFAHISELRDALLGMLGGMDTHPPGSLTMSGARPQAPMIAPHAMQTILPAVQLPQMPTPASGMHPSMYYGQYASQIAPPYATSPSTPWWVWFVGGALAVGLGIGAAVWYAGGTEPVQVVQPSIQPQPVVTQAVEPPPQKPEQLEVKFDSLPSGGVYADGRSAELCRTPCTFNIDPSDGGALDRRTYVVRSDGYKDMSVVVDLASAKREFKVTLEQLEPVQEAVADKQPTRPGRERPNRGKVKKSTRSDKVTADKLPDPATPVTSPDKPRTDPDQLIDPTDGRPLKKPKPPKNTIDPTDLADPFKRKR
jgi:serine/threonine-protein kinase